MERCHPPTLVCRVQRCILSPSRVCFRGTTDRQLHFLVHLIWHSKLSVFDFLLEQKTISWQGIYPFILRINYCCYFAVVAASTTTSRCPPCGTRMGVAKLFQLPNQLEQLTNFLGLSKNVSNGYLPDLLKAISVTSSLTPDPKRNMRMLAFDLEQPNRHQNPTFRPLKGRAWHLRSSYGSPLPPTGLYTDKTSATPTIIAYSFQ